MISSGLVYSVRLIAMPMLADVNTSRPPMGNGACERLLHAERDDVGLHLVADCSQHDGELVAAEAREGVARPQARLEPARHRHEQFVAHHVAEAVVDDLEAIEVEIQHREPAAAPLLVLGETPAEPLDERGAIQQPGQRIARAGTADLLLRDRTLRDVGERPGDARDAPVRVARRRCRRHSTRR